MVRDFSVKPVTLIVDDGASVTATARFDYDIPAGDEPKTDPCEAPAVYVAIISAAGEQGTTPTNRRNTLVSGTRIVSQVTVDRSSMRC